MSDWNSAAQQDAAGHSFDMADKLGFDLNTRGELMRHFRRKLLRLSIAILLQAVLFSSLSFADSFSFKGTFEADDQIQLLDLTLLSDSIVTFQSLGYGGGTTAAGMMIPPGGFDSLFTWFDAAGNQIGTNDDGCGAAKSSNNGACLDAYFRGFLQAGQYVLALTESGNFPIGSLSDGFTEQGAGDFTASGTCTAFCDSFGNTDNGNWVTDISGVYSASPAGSPEPVTFGLTLSGLLAFLAPTLCRRARQHTN